MSHHHLLHHQRAAITFAALVTTALAQSGGPTVGFAQGFSVDGATPIPSFTKASVIVSETQLDATYPVPWTPPPGVADFSTLPIPTTLDVDGLSIGLDWVVSNGAGVAIVPPGQWAALTYSTSRATLGTSGSLVAAEVAKPDGSAGDVYAWVVPGSALPPVIVGVPLRALDSTEIAVTVLPVVGNLDAHDLFIGLVYRDNPQLAAALPPPTTYFTVSDATKGMIPLGWGPVALQSGATVYSTTWNPVTSTWGPVGIAFTPTDFGLTASEDIDGLAVDVVRGEVLFSCDIALSPGRDPLLWSAIGSSSNTTYVLPGPGPTSVSSVLGIGAAPDDLDGICALDPGSLGNPHQARLDRMIGTWSNPFVPTAPTTLQASASRTFDPAIQREFLVSFMTGWPPPGNPAPGAAICALTIGPPQIGPYVTTNLFLRPNNLSPYFLFEGHPERCEFAIPPFWSLSNVPVTFLWAAASNQGFALSHPVTIRL